MSASVSPASQHAPFLPPPGSSQEATEAAVRRDKAVADQAQAAAQSDRVVKAAGAGGKLDILA